MPLDALESVVELVSWPSVNLGAPVLLAAVEMDAPRRGRGPVWLQSQIVELRRLMGEKLTVAEIAQRMNISSQRVFDKIRNLGFSVNPNKIWGELDMQYLHERYRIDPPEAIALHLHRSVNAVRVRASLMGLTIPRSDGVQAWMEFEDQYVRQHYGVEATSSIADELGRTVGSVRARAVKLGVTKLGPEPWSAIEIEELEQLFYDDLPISEISEKLGRPLDGVRSKIYDLGFRRNTSRPWDDQDDGYLREKYGTIAASSIACEIGRTATAVYARASTLGLTEGAPPPYTPWEDAQLMAGYSTGVPLAQLSALIGRPASGIVSRASLLGLRHANKANDWTDEEEARALALAEEGVPYSRIGKMLGEEGFSPRTKVAVGSLVRSLGFERGWGRPWSTEEDEALRAAYSSGASLTPLIMRLGRSRHSIRWRAGYLKLQGTHVKRNGFRQGRDWTREEEATLRAEYGKVPTREIAAKIDRELRAVLVRAHALGLVHGYIKPFTAEDDAAIRAAFELGLSMTDLSKALDRDIAVVSKRAKRQLDIHFANRSIKAPRTSLKNRPQYTRDDILRMAQEAALLCAVPALAAE